MKKIKPLVIKQGEDKVMFKKVFKEALDFYLWEVIDPLVVPEYFHPGDDKDYTICSIPVDGKNGLRTIQWYDVKNRRFETHIESSNRIIKSREQNYGKMILMPVYEKEWADFQEWKGDHEN